MLEKFNTDQMQRVMTDIQTKCQSVAQEWMKENPLGTFEHDPEVNFDHEHIEVRVYGNHFRRIKKDGSLGKKLLACGFKCEKAGQGFDFFLKNPGGNEGLSEFAMTYGAQVAADSLQELGFNVQVVPIKDWSKVTN